MEPIKISPEQLEKLADGIRIMESVVNREQMPELWIYALTSEWETLAKAQDCLQEQGDRDLDEESGQTFAAPQLSEVAVALPVGGDDLYYLAGSGMDLSNEAFAYRVAGEGSRTTDFTWSRDPAKLRISDFKQIELADSDIYLDEFLDRNGTAVPGNPTVKRDQEATQPKRSPRNSIDSYLAS
jgi:hypothetical protein